MRKNSRGAFAVLSRRPPRPPLFLALRAARRRHPLGAVHGRAGEQGDGEALRALQHARGHGSALASSRASAERRRTSSMRSPSAGTPSPSIRTCSASPTVWGSPRGTPPKRWRRGSCGRSRRRCGPRRTTCSSGTGGKSAIRRGPTARTARSPRGASSTMHSARKNVDVLPPPARRNMRRAGGGLGSDPYKFFLLRQ